MDITETEIDLHKSLEKVLNLKLPDEGRENVCLTIDGTKITINEGCINFHTF